MVSSCRVASRYMVALGPNVRVGKGFAHSATQPRSLVRVLGGCLDLVVIYFISEQLHWTRSHVRNSRSALQTQAGRALCDTLE